MQQQVGAFGGFGEKPAEAFGRHRGAGARSGELQAELIDIAGLGAETDRQRHRHRHDAAILARHESNHEFGRGVGDEQHAIAAVQAEAEQAAGHGMGARAQLGVGQHRQQLGASIVEIETGLAPRGVIERLREAGEAATLEG